MSFIKPFAAIRPQQKIASRVAALPYDVYNTEEAREEVAKEPLSFLQIDRGETLLPEGASPYSSEAYQVAKKALWAMVEKGELVREESACFYLYELTMNGRVQTGFVALASVDEYLENKIKKHENTREKKEEDRIRHVSTLHAQTGPIFLACPNRENINGMMEEMKKQEALYDFVSPDGIRHRVFRIDQASDIAQIQENFKAIPSLYIADGHHRTASAIKVALGRRNERPHYTGEEEFNYFLSVIFPDDQLKILDYNRVVLDLNGLSEVEFLEKVKSIFPTEVNQEADKHPTKKGEFSMYLNGTWYRCHIPAEYVTGDPVGDMDVSVLQDRLLNPVLGIREPGKDDRLDFVGGIRGLEELERRVSLDCKAAFAMYPPSIQEMFDVADAGLLMPAKSTWFEPKLRSGIFIHEIEPALD
jgi:uncharacterized protein (DUF1015 family)